MWHVLAWVLVGALLGRRHLAMAAILHGPVRLVPVTMRFTIRGAISLNRRVLRGISGALVVAQQAGWTILQVNFVAGLTSVNVERFEKALETLGVPKQKWAQVRTKFMRVLLEEHDNILRSYQAQKHGGGDGMGAIVGQRMDLGLGPV